jgi:hypothetical protein
MQSVETGHIFGESRAAKERRVKMTSADLRAISILAIKNGNKKSWVVLGGYFGESEQFVRFEDIPYASLKTLIERLARVVIAEKRRPNLVKPTAFPDKRIWVFGITKREVEVFFSFHTPLENVDEVEYGDRPSGFRLKEYTGKWWPRTEY